MISAIRDLQVTPMLPTELQVRWPFGSGEEAKNDFQDGRHGGPAEYPQSMFSSKNKKNNVYPCKRQFYYIQVGFKGVKII